MIKPYFKKLTDAVFGVYALVITLVVIFLITCPLILISPTLTLRRYVGRSGVRLWLLLLFIPFPVRGKSNLPDTPCVVVCNHASYVDGIVLTAALPARFTFVVQSKAAAWPLVGQVIQRMGVHFVNRWSVKQGAADTRAIIKKIQNGTSLAVFPEGTFTGDRGLLPFHNGAFLMASKANAEIVPVVLHRTRDFFGEGQKLPRWQPLSADILPSIGVCESGREAVLAKKEEAHQAIFSALRPLEQVARADKDGNIAP